MICPYCNRHEMYLKDGIYHCPYCHSIPATKPACPICGARCGHYWNCSLNQPTERVQP
jgi:C4-type Zn-finger protein